MAAEAATFLPGPLPVDTSHVLQCPASALPFLQELRARRPVNEDDPSKKLPQVQAVPTSEHADNATRFKSVENAIGDMKLESGASEPERGLTENFAHTYVSSGNACVDFLFHVLPQTERNDAHRRLKAAWAEDPATALRLVMQLRAVRGTGKSDRSSFFHCVTWLYQNHPRTLIQNLWLVPEFGCFKDLLEIVRLALAEEGVDAKEDGTVAWNGMNEGKKMRKMRVRKGSMEEGKSVVAKRGMAEQKSREERVAENRRKMAEESERAAVARKEAHARRAAAVAHAYESSERLRAVHNAVAAIFAAALKGDLETMRAFEERRARKNAEGGGAKAETSGEGKKKRKWMGRPAPRLSLAAKWAPSPGKSGRWKRVAYGRVPSVCMKKTRKLFLSHDEARFTEYLEDVKGGEAKIAAGALLPHEVVKTAMKAAEDSGDTVGELQWKAMVADVRSKGSLGNSMAVCDVSGSMAGTPMEVAVALSLLVSEVSSEPWKNHLITFSATPKIYRVKGETLVERVRRVQRMGWGYNTNFQSVFDLLLSRAKKFQLDPADMVQRLYVFSDMQFDEAGAASGADWETDHQAIVRRYTAAGYPVPQIVYWNLRGDASASSTPVAASEEGVALVSGFSKGMLLAVLEGKEISPMIVLEEAIKGKLFELIQVVD
ncbi:unnamed protein product [Closterium sp. Yama58-4]|nr:unnamed protein product [Closterium sp. Yama58-4]